MEKLGVLTLGLIWGTAVACSGPAHGAAQSATGGAAGNAGATSSGGSAGVAGGQGGGAGSATGGASAGSGGSNALSCKGDFGAPRLHFTATAAAELASVTLSPDELELFYGERDAATSAWHIARASRASRSALFAEGQPIAELETACDPSLRRALDLSADGLRLYFVCYSTTADLVPLHLATRTGSGAAFVVDGTTYGSVASSPGISADELELFSSRAYGPTESAGAVHYVRDNRTAAFGVGQPIPGLESLVIATPDPSPDGLELFVYYNGTIAAAYRPSATPTAIFSTPTPLSMLTPVSASVFGSPEISHDCHTLYFIRADAMTTTTTTMSYSVLSASR